MHYTSKNYVLKFIYNDENECMNDELSLFLFPTHSLFLSLPLSNSQFFSLFVAFAPSLCLFHNHSFCL